MPTWTRHFLLFCHPTHSLYHHPFPYASFLFFPCLPLNALTWMSSCHPYCRCTVWSYVNLWKTPPAPQDVCYRVFSISFPCFYQFFFVSTRFWTVRPFFFLHFQKIDKKALTTREFERKVKKLKILQLLVSIYLQTLRASLSIHCYFAPLSIARLSKRTNNYPHN